VATLRQSAELVHGELLARLRDTLAASFPVEPEGSPERIAGYLEDGLSLLTSHAFRIDNNVGLSMDRIEACRRLADQDARFRFIYRIPSSVGWGAAIGAAVERALYGETQDAVRTVTALLNSFMTFLDGLLDEAPDVLRPHRDRLLQLVRDGPNGSAGLNGIIPEDHPYTAMCFLIARLWIGHFNRLRHPGQVSGLRDEFLRAACRSMAVEYAVCDSGIGNPSPPSMNVLYGRTCWPLWTQSLAVMCQHEWPRDTDLLAFRDLIFRIGEFAAYLDDVRDYVSDCIAGQWNTASLAFYSRHPFPLEGTEDAQTYLLANLADESFAETVIQTGRDIRNSIEEQFHRLRGVDTDCLRPLLADLTYEYVG
jgi:hypothetical protein